MRWRVVVLATTLALWTNRAVANLQDHVNLDGVGVWEQRGYYRRELSLTRPYQGSGMDVPFWDYGGSTIVTQDQIRLTADAKSQHGYLWSQVPLNVRDWEVMFTFKVSGTSGDLFGDGMAFWYAAERMQDGPVFASKDFFRGLGVFLDTYSNHNGAHTHGHPYLSAMVANGSTHYDHDRDGTHTQLGGEHTGCETKFRNKNYETNLLFRYVEDTLSIYTDIGNKGVWAQCLSVNDVRLPTGLYFGVSAATGDLSDAHDVIAIRFYEIEVSRPADPSDYDRSRIEPQAAHHAAPRDHHTDPKPSKLGWFGTILLVLVGIVVIGGVLGFGVHFFNQRSLHQRKRFY